MSKKDQLKKNLKLSEKLAGYVVSNPDAVKNMPKRASFVVFSSEDSDLNKMNNQLVISLKSEGRKVVKATESNNKVKPWLFSLAT